MAIQQGMYGYAVIDASKEERSTFIKRTYIHLAAAILIFTALEAMLLGPLKATTLPIARSMITGYNWLIVLLAFMGVGYLADYWARTAASRTMQYVGLIVYVVAQAIIFMPLLFIATYKTNADVVPTAGILTLTLFVGLTATVFITGKDFSFLRTILSVGAFVALGVIVVAVLYGFSLGAIFSIVLIGLASGYILYYTSQIQRHYHPDQHVAASLALFAAVALMFWYVIILLLSLSRD
jgi:FtsH-binding integral membrane protein